MAISRARAVKVPPYAVHSEKVVLGSMIAEPKLIAPMNKIIGRGEVFFRVEHGRIFDTLVEMQSRHKPATTEALMHALEAHKAMERLGGESLLRELALKDADPETVDDQARVVAEKAKMRWFIDAVSDSLHDAYYTDDDYAAVLKRAKDRLAKLDETTS